MMITFDEVSYRAQKTGVCPFCGKRAVRSEKFWQTINPYNKNKSTRIPKTRDEIYTELKAEAGAWKAEPTYHKRCAELGEVP